VDCGEEKDLDNPRLNFNAWKREENGEDHLRSNNLAGEISSKKGLRKREITKRKNEYYGS